MLVKVRLIFDSQARIPYYDSLAMKKQIDPEKQALIENIQRKIAYVVATDDYTAEQKEAIARRFFQALESGEQ